MARNREPILKTCKALGIAPQVMGIAKETKRDPHANQRRKKTSEYGLQLKEKQKVKFIYGVLEKQFRHYFELAERQNGVTGENLLSMLERRIDNVVFRTGFASSRRQARQLVLHGHFLVNGKKVDVPSYQMSQDDVLSVKQKSKEVELFKAAREGSSGVVPKWLEVNADELTAKVVALPAREDIDYPLQENMIVEYYSR